MVLEPLDFEDPKLSKYTKSILEISLFLIVNNLMTKEELNTFKTNLITILKAKGIPNENDHNSRKLSNGKKSFKSLKSSNTAGPQVAETINVSTLQSEEYITDLVICLVQIEKLQQREY